MGEHSQQAFTSDKLKKFAASGNGGNVGQRDRDAAATSDDFGRAAAKGSDSSAFAAGGAAKAPSLGRAARATGGRINRADGGKTRDLNKVSDAGPWHYGEEPAVRKEGGRVNRAKGGRAKGKTVVNVIVGSKDRDQPPAAPMAAPMPPPMPPPRPPAAPPGGMPPGAGGGAPVTNIMPSGAAPMGAAGAPPGGGQIPPGLLGRARGGRISEKYGAGSGLGRMERAKRQGHGKVELPD